MRSRYPWKISVKTLHSLSVERSRFTLKGTCSRQLQNKLFQIFSPKHKMMAYQFVEGNFNPSSYENVINHTHELLKAKKRSGTSSKKAI